MQPKGGLRFYANRVNMKMKRILNEYKAPTVEVWQLKHGISILNYLSAGGDVTDLEPGDGDLINDEWDEFG